MAKRGLFSYPSLDPNDSRDYGEVFTGYSLNTAGIGSAASPMTEMQLAEVDARLKEGMSTVEMGTISPDKFESIPKGHFEEMQQLAKLANADITLHAPLIDPSGFSQQRWGGEEARQGAERMLKSVIDRAIDANPNGMPVTIHGAGADVPAYQWAEVKGKKEPQIEMMTAVNAETGEMVPVSRKIEYDPVQRKEVPKEPMQRLEEANQRQWEGQL